MVGLIGQPIILGGFVVTFITTFLEGIASFLSPCILPMLPVFVLYFSGSTDPNEKPSTKSLIIKVLSFIIGFSIMFTLLGAFASSLGSFLSIRNTGTRIVSGGIIMLFGLMFTGLIPNPFHLINAKVNSSKNVNKKLNALSALFFGIVFAITYSPCIGPFLGAALIQASQAGHVMKGTLLLLSYSIGLGVPFFIAAMFLEHIKGSLNFIKAHLDKINIISGILLFLLGLSIATNLPELIKATF